MKLCCASFWFQKIRQKTISNSDIFNICSPKCWGQLEIKQMYIFQTHFQKNAETGEVFAQDKRDKPGSVFLKLFRFGLGSNQTENIHSVRFFRWFSGLIQNLFFWTGSIQRTPMTMIGMLKIRTVPRTMHIFRQRVAAFNRESHHRSARQGADKMRAFDLSARCGHSVLEDVHSAWD